MDEWDIQAIDAAVLREAGIRPTSDRAHVIYRDGVFDVVFEEVAPRFEMRFYPGGTMFFRDERASRTAIMGAIGFA